MSSHGIAWASTLLLHSYTPPSLVLYSQTKPFRPLLKRQNSPVSDNFITLPIPPLKIFHDEQQHTLPFRVVTGLSFEHLYQPYGLPSFKIYTGGSGLGGGGGGGGATTVLRQNGQLLAAAGGGGGAGNSGSPETCCSEGGAGGGEMGDDGGSPGLNLASLEKPATKLAGTCRGGWCSVDPSEVSLGFPFR